jgi:predicted nucleic acid-binding protein
VIENAEGVEPAERLSVCRDPNDDKFLECAVAAGADYIVSEDLDLLDLRQFRDIKILTVAEFLALLGPE